MLNRADRNSLYPPFSLAQGTAQDGASPNEFTWLCRFVSATKCSEYLSCQMLKNSLWWIMFRLDQNHPRVWETIQEFSYVCYGPVQGISNPLRFFPVSIHPENGGPEKHLLWRIECYDPKYTPTELASALSLSIPKRITSWPPKAETNQ